MNAMRFAVKHAVATGVVVGGIVAFTAASYFALLAGSARGRTVGRASRVPIHGALRSGCQRRLGWSHPIARNGGCGTDLRQEAASSRLSDSDRDGVGRSIPSVCGARDFGTAWSVLGFCRGSGRRDVRPAVGSTGCLLVVDAVRRLAASSGDPSGACCQSVSSRAEPAFVGLANRPLQPPTGPDVVRRFHSH